MGTAELSLSVYDTDWCNLQQGAPHAQLGGIPNTLRSMKAFKALSAEERWQVRRLVFRGEAPNDPRMALAAIELAERYQQQPNGRGLLWLARVAGVSMTVVTIVAAISGELPQALIFGFAASANFLHLLFNPATRPDEVAQSLEASRAILARE